MITGSWSSERNYDFLDVEIIVYAFIMDQRLTLDPDMTVDLEPH